MAYHSRPELTKMSMYHMKRVIDMFNNAGHKSIGIVIGDKNDMSDYAESLGLEHVEYPNDDLTEKFITCWISAIRKNTEYMCWLGSNNIHSDEYWQKCIETLGGNKKVSFGCKKILIVSTDKEKQETCVFNTRGAHLTSSGQFFLNYSFKKCINIFDVYEKGQTFNFDGKVNEKFFGMWGEEVVECISKEPEDCIDIKNNENIHTYESYIKVDSYPRYDNRDVIFSKHKELIMLENGDFR